jgi:hypothetical protein
VTAVGGVLAETVKSTKPNVAVAARDMIGPELVPLIVRAKLAAVDEVQAIVAV